MHSIFNKLYSESWRVTLGSSNGHSSSTLCNNRPFWKFICMHLFMMNSGMKWCVCFYIPADIYMYTNSPCFIFITDSFLWPDYLIFLEPLPCLYGIWIIELFAALTFLGNNIWIEFSHIAYVLWETTCDRRITDVFTSDVPFCLQLWRNPLHISHQCICCHAG
jgi:hypothetical protein